jgi:hypothetical protein
MKSNNRSSAYFSAYPLKAIMPENPVKAAQYTSPYLTAILSGQTRTQARVRVFPMANPYNENGGLKVASNTITPFDRINRNRMK